MLPADKKLAEFKAQTGVTQQQVEEMRKILAPERLKEAQDAIVKARNLALEGSRKLDEELQQRAGKWIGEAQFKGEVERENKKLEAGYKLLKGAYDAQVAMERAQAEGAIRIGAIYDTSKDARFNAEMRLLAVRKQADDEAYRHEREMAEAEHAYDGQLEAAKTELRIKHEKEVSELAMQAAEKVAEKWRQQFDEVAHAAQALAHTLLTKPAEFGKQLASTLHEAILKPITEGIGNLAARALTPLIYGSDGQGGIAGIFKGIFGGPKQDPLKNAMDVNTTVTAQNSMAVAGLTAVMMAFTAGGAPATAAPVAMPGMPVPAISAPAANIGSLPMSPPPGVFTLPSFPTASGATSPEGVLRAAIGGGRTAPAVSGGASWMSNLRSSWSSLKSFAGFGNVTTDSQGGKWVTIGNESVPLDSIGGYANAIGRSPAAGMAGSMLAMNGLLGSGAGSWRGVMEGTAGGAMLGFQVGGPFGAAVGASLGLEIGLAEKLFGVESPENEAKRLVKRLYSINIDNAMAKQIVAIAQQKYAGHVSVAVRDPDVRKMLMLYSEGTGQKMPLSATTPQSASLVELGGRLYQQATYVNGAPYAFQSNLPVLGGYATGTYPSSPSTVVLNVNGQSAADLLEGRIANTVTPGYVQSQWSSATAGSDGRLANSAVLQQPGLVIA